MKEQQTPRKRNLWAIVLAGGKGARISSLSRELIGQEVPKQYLPLLSSKRSLLQETHERLSDFVPQERTVVVVAKEWAGLATKQLQDYPGVRVIPQPSDRGTAPGILLPLCHVLAHAPDADVVVTPSDHHIANPQSFKIAVNETLQTIDAVPNTMALLGVKPEYAATDFGWIQPAEMVGSARRIARFIEKPDVQKAEVLMKGGALWNTLIIISRASTLWTTIFRGNPSLAALLEPYIQQVARSPLSAVGYCEYVYSKLPTVDFSSDILQEANNLVVSPMKSAGWFDCGTPERLFDWLRKTPTSDSPFRRLMDAA